MNQVTVNFVPCSPTPANGYNVQWRVKNSADPFTDAGNFYETPAVFFDNTNPAGTLYEGIIRSDCSESGESGTNYGTDINWTTEGGDESGVACTAWTITGGTTGSQYDYVPCDAEGPDVDNVSTVSIPIGGSQSGLCAKDSYGMVKTSGDGTATAGAPCGTLCRLHEFSVYGGDGESIHVTGLYCNGDPYSYIGFVGDGAPPSVCLQVGSVSANGTNVVLVNDTNLCP